MSDHDDGTLKRADFCNAQGVADLLGVDRRTIYRAVADGRLPVIRLGAKGKAYRFYKPDALRLRDEIAPTPSY